MKREIIFYAFTFLSINLFSSCDFKKETKQVTPVITSPALNDSVLVKKETELQNNEKYLQEVHTTIDSDKFSDIITENDRIKLNIFLPITRVEKYKNLGDEYFAVFTEDRVIPKSPDFPNSRINFYLLKKLSNDNNSSNNYEIVNKFSENYPVDYYGGYDVKYKFLNHACNFDTVDDNGMITPIIFTQENIIEYGTKKTSIYVFSNEKMIKIEINNKLEGTNSIRVSPYFYTLSSTIQNKVKQTIDNLNSIYTPSYTDAYEDNEAYIGFDGFWDAKKCFWNGTTAYHIFKENPLTTHTVQLPTAASYSLEDLKNMYESTFPASQDIGLDFGLSDDLELHSGEIHNNLDLPIILPDYKHENIYVSDKNEILTQTMYEHQFLELDPKVVELYDDNNINYNLKDGYHVAKWDYQNGWKSENLPLFPEEMQEGKYIAYSKLSYFDGEQEQAIYSKKHILNYIEPKNKTKDKELLKLQVKYDSIYPTSEDLQIDTGISYYNKTGSLHLYQYMPYIENVSKLPIDTNGSSFVFYFINNKEEIFKKEVTNAFYNVLAHNESDILGDSYFTHLVDDYWVENNMIYDAPIIKGLDKEEYLIYSALISNTGHSYYSKKEFINFTNTALYKSQKTDLQYQSYPEFKKEITENKSIKGEQENSSNCFNVKSTDNLYSITTCYYPKQFKNKQLYSILKYSNIDVTDKLIQQLPRRDTIYLTRHNDKVSFNIPKTTRDTLKIDLNTTQYHIYIKDNFPVIEKYFRLN
ncbi:hypothetical protein [uncultured Nonlabens sp.]|uniref:hypothetical protein n=1 Tax=uncultured Nonlabens sp. TaxID=859306 RepID=UPI00260CE4E2|nr:hypothetical protein [uncultured Nonlabens sp.]